jgi:hypothetical protein
MILKENYSEKIIAFDGASSGLLRHAGARERQ